MSEIYEVKRAVEDVETAVNRLEQTVRDNSFGQRIKIVGWLILFDALFMCLDYAWHSKLRYAMQYGVNTAQVTIGKKPHDCEFFSAPIGEKNCKYKAGVNDVRWATSTAGTPIASFDGGKTWNSFTPDAGADVPKYSTVESVMVMWEKEAN